VLFTLSALAGGATFSCLAFAVQRTPNDDKVSNHAEFV
jgi:hypothetical protein